MNVHILKNTLKYIGVRGCDASNLLSTGPKNNLIHVCDSICLSIYLSTEREKRKRTKKRKEGRERNVIDNVNGSNMLTIGDILAACLNV